MAFENAVMNDLLGIVQPRSQESTDGDESTEAALAIEAIGWPKQVLASQTITDPADCSESLLEGMDQCVGCVEGVESQHEFEINLGTKEFCDDSFGNHHNEGLTSTEAALIRLQVMESTQQEQKSQQPNILPDMDVLNLCTGSDDVAMQSVVFSKQTRRTETADESFSDKYGNADQLQNPFYMCAICQDKSTETQCVVFCQFPCCTDESGIRVCTSCLVISTTPTTDGCSRAGHCPRCKSWIRTRAPTSTAAQSELDIELVTHGEPTCVCKICNQTKDFLLADGECDACFLGQRHPLLYECQACLCAQRIPHPLYRYQATPEAFGTVKWACQGQTCGGFSYWRIIPEQIALIPVGDAPGSWRIDSMQAARRRAMDARQTMSAQNECVIL